MAFSFMTATANLDNRITPALDEPQLVERARQGDRQAFGVIYQRYVDRVYGYVAFRVRDTSVAEDLTQEVFIQAMRALGTFDWRGSLAPWLLKIARNTVIDHWRRMGRRPELPMSATETDDDDEDEDGGRLGRLVAEEDEAVTHAEGALDRERIMNAMVCLTDLQKQVVELRFAASLSIKETAEVMGRSEGAIKNLQHHALKSLKRYLVGKQPVDASRGTGGTHGAGGTRGINRGTDRRAIGL